MKNSKLRTVLPILCALVVMGQRTYAQSVAITSVSGSSFCTGDSMTVQFTASGPFGHKNAFTLQLSNDTGSFENGFYNLTSIFDSIGGSLSFVVPITTTPFSHKYRLRVMAAVPYTVSADNGSDINIGQIPKSLRVTRDDVTGVGVLTWLQAYTEDNYTTYGLTFDFGAGASPATYTGDLWHQRDVTTTYSTGGWKTLTVTSTDPGGCSTSMSWSKYVWDCTIPPIPSYAYIVGADTALQYSATHSVLWVNPGVHVKIDANQSDTIFQEPGSTVEASEGCVIFLKAGAVATGTGNIQIYANGASVEKGVNSFAYNCPSLDFDYEFAPPNKAVPFAAVQQALAKMPIEISPNPTPGAITITGAPANLMRVDVLDVLGATVQHVENIHGQSLQVDLSKLASGTYYVRLGTPTSVVTKRVVRQ